MRYTLVVNGLGHAFLQEFGCSCRRCRLRKRTANTSVSLLGEPNAPPESPVHILIDVGAGVVDSLVKNPALTGDKAHLGALLLSHWHPDHVLDLNRLCESWRRTMVRRDGAPTRLQAWCRSGTASWLRKTHSYEVGLLSVTESGEYSPPGTMLPAVPLHVSNLTVTPVTVSHVTADLDPADPRNPLPCCAAFVIENDGRKAVLLWDIDNRNDWIVSPATMAQHAAKEKLSAPDYLFIDCNTWEAETASGKNTGHASFRTVLRYADALSLPDHATTVLVHLSGHEDGRGRPGWGWPDRTWQSEATAVWASGRLRGTVQVPAIGDAFPL